MQAIEVTHYLFQMNGNVGREEAEKLNAVILGDESVLSSQVIPGGHQLQISCIRLETEEEREAWLPTVKSLDGVGSVKTGDYSFWGDPPSRSELERMNDIVRRKLGGILPNQEETFGRNI